MDEKRILLVEDEQRIADTLRYGLEEIGYEVSVAYDGNVGLDFFVAGDFELIVLDISLPGINGLELCRRIRSVNEDVPIIMLTALSALEDKIVGYDAGADDYIIKPFEFKELLMKMRVLLRRTEKKAVPAVSMLQADDLRMNLDTKEVSREDKSISLTTKEFQLLEYLLKNKNRVVSRADIAINVWDIDFDTNTNIIDVYINYVRNKVDKPFEKKLIHTQIGMGYILKDP